MHTDFYHLTYVTQYEVWEKEEYTKVTSGRSCPQEVTLISFTSFLYILGQISSLVFHSCCFSVLSGSTLPLFLCLSKCTFPAVPPKSTVELDSLIQCCWEPVFGLACNIISSHQEPWKTLHSVTQSHFKRPNKKRDSFKILFTKTFITGLLILWT